MALFGDANDYPLCPTGEQLFRISGLDQTARWKSGKNAGKPAYGWRCSTVEIQDENGEPYLINKMTGVNYHEGGSDFLSVFLDHLFPKKTTEQKRALDEEDLMNVMFYATVYHQTTERGTFATFDFETIRPAKGDAFAKDKRYDQPKKPTTATDTKKLPQKVDKDDPFTMPWDDD